MTYFVVAEGHPAYRRGRICLNSCLSRVRIRNPIRMKRDEVEGRCSVRDGASALVMKGRNDQMSDNSPADPISDLVASAVQLHEIYESLTHAGFTEAQAMQVITGLVCTSVSGTS